ARRWFESTSRSISTRMHALLNADWHASVAARIASAFASMTVIGPRAVTVVVRRCAISEVQKLAEAASRLDGGEQLAEERDVHFMTMASRSPGSSGRSLVGRCASVLRIA